MSERWIPMIPPPFNYGPVTDQAFFGREAALRQATESLRVSLATAIIGERRTGKTSLAMELRRRHQSGTELWVMLEVYLSIEELERRRVRAFAAALKVDPGQAGCPDLKALLALAATRGYSRVVFVLEEVDIYLHNREGAKGLEVFQQLLHPLPQPEAPLSYQTLVTGCFRLLELVGAEIFTPSARVELSPLAPAAQKELLESPLRASLFFTEDALRQLDRISGGNPFLLKLLANHTIRRLNGALEKRPLPGPIPLLSTDVLGGARVMLQESDLADHWVYLKKWHLSPLELALLERLAQETSIGEDETSRTAADSLIRKQHLLADKGQLRFRVEALRYAILGTVPHPPFRVTTPVRWTLQAQEVQVNERRHPLSTSESEVLKALLAAQGQTCDLELLLAAAGPPTVGAPSDELDHLAGLIVSLQRHLGDDPKDPSLLVEVDGLGYCLRPGEDEVTP